jgi:hypothetical protein
MNFVSRYRFTFFLLCILNGITAVAQSDDARSFLQTEISYQDTSLTCIRLQVFDQMHYDTILSDLKFTFEHTDYPTERFYRFAERFQFHRIEPGRYTLQHSGLASMPIDILPNKMNRVSIFLPGGLLLFRTPDDSLEHAEFFSEVKPAHVEEAETKLQSSLDSMYLATGEYLIRSLLFPNVVQRIFVVPGANTFLPLPAAFLRIQAASDIDQVFVSFNGRDQLYQRTDLPSPIKPVLAPLGTLHIRYFRKDMERRKVIELSDPEQVYTLILD